MDMNDDEIVPDAKFSEMKIDKASVFIGNCAATTGKNEDHIMKTEGYI
jgi:hypothetical protein